MNKTTEIKFQRNNRPKSCKDIELELGLIKLPTQICGGSKPLQRV